MDTSGLVGLDGCLFSMLSKRRIGSGLDRTTKSAEDAMVSSCLVYCDSCLGVRVLSSAASGRDWTIKLADDGDRPWGSDEEMDDGVLAPRC